MKNIFFGLILFSFSCQNLIKNEDAKVENEVKVENKQSDSLLFVGFEANNEEFVDSSPIVINRNDLIGNWVGWFVANLSEDENEKTALFLDNYGDGYFWGRENKINIAITSIREDSVFGHSVVAGNDRPFKGIISEKNNKFNIIVSEPGGNKYDGKFEFSVKINSTKLIGIWNAFGKLEIPKRKYELSRKEFIYNKNQQLDSNGYQTFIDWEKGMKKVKMDKEVYSDGEMDGYLTSTKIIYFINASTQLISDKQAKEMTQADLSIIRNMIYARHGYSFKRKPLRVFFDAQSWYLPISADITKDLTELEKKNIKLLLKYEKNAKAYYEYFGR